MLRGKAMRVLVIGSEGNIGRPLVRHLRAAGHAVIEADIRPGWRDGYVTADICQPLDLEDAIAAADVVMLLSAVVSREVCEQAAMLAYATNLQGTAGIARLCAKHGARLVFFSTSEVYGPTDELMREDRVPAPNNRYGLTKWLGEQIVNYEVKASGLQAVILRPFMIYGEDEEEGDHRSAIVRFAVHLSRGQPITVHRDTWRSWMHVGDACDAIETACHLDTCTTINIGHPDIYPMLAVAEKIRELLGAPESLIQVEPQPPRMTPIKRPALGRQYQMLGIQPRIGLDDGLAFVCGRYV